MFRTIFFTTDISVCCWHACMPSCSMHACIYAHAVEQNISPSFSCLLMIIIVPQKNMFWQLNGYQLDYHFLLIVYHYLFLITWRQNSYILLNPKRPIGISQNLYIRHRKVLLYYMKIFWALNCNFHGKMTLYFHQTYLLLYAILIKNNSIFLISYKYVHHSVLEIVNCDELNDSIGKLLY